MQFRHHRPHGFTQRRRRFHRQIAAPPGGIGGLAPERRSDLARFGLRAVLGGSIATFMTATIAGVLSYFG